jgi:hypothetical protein
MIWIAFLVAASLACVTVFTGKLLMMWLTQFLNAARKMSVALSSAIGSTKWVRIRRRSCSVVDVVRGVQAKTDQELTARG